MVRLYFNLLLLLKFYSRLNQESTCYLINKNLGITINNSLVYINLYISSQSTRTKDKAKHMLSLLNLFFYIFLCTLEAFQAAVLGHYERSIRSPFTGKTYIFYDSHSKVIFSDAKSICATYPNGRLASLSPSSGDISFLGGYIADDEPHWIAELEGTPLIGGVCAAIYSAGAVAIPKPPATSNQDQSKKSPCQNYFNVLCEIADY